MKSQREVLNKAVVDCEATLACVTPVAQSVRSSDAKVHRNQKETNKKMYLQRDLDSDGTSALFAVRLTSKHMMLMHVMRCIRACTCHR